jgi:single-stranded DNA-binding protein
LQSRSWEQEGQKRSKVEVLASDVTFLDGRGDENGGGSSMSGGNSNSAPSAPKPSKSNNKDVVIEDIGDDPINLDDIPF